MDIKDFGKQLDGISSNNSFDNAIFLPNDVANILPKFIYWNKEMEALWIQNPNEEDNVKRLSTSFFVTIKTNEKGLFINGNLAVKWDNKRIVKDNAVMYQSHGAALALMETGILCKFGDDEIDSIIQFNIDSDIKDFVEKNQSAYVLLSLCNYSYWKKEEICVVRSSGTQSPKYRGRIMANETGLYLDGELRYKWDDYLPIIRKKNNEGGIGLLKKTQLANWGSSKYGFYPQKDYFIITDDHVVDKDETVMIGYTCKLSCNYNSLSEKKDLPVLKEQYYTLIKENNSVFSPNVTIDCAEFSVNTFKLLLDFKWIIDTNLIILNFIDFYKRSENNQVISVSNQRFKNGTFTIVLDKQIEYTLKLASTKFEDHDSYFYYLSKKIVREIGFSQRLDIKLKGKDCDYSIKANELINLAKTFDEELFSSPKHEMDYYKAEFLFEKDEYLDANRYILAAIKEEPNNEKYKELAEKIKYKLIAIEFKNYDNAQKLYNDKKFEESVKLLDSIYVVEKGEEIKSLRKKVVNAWVVDLTAKGDANMRKKNTVFAINNYKKALKLHPEDADLQEKLKIAENVLGSKMKEYGKKALKIAGIVLVLLVGLVIYSNVKSYIDEQEYKAQLEAKWANDEQNNKAIETRLNGICKELSTMNGDTDKYLSQEFKNLLYKGVEIGGPNFLDSNIWLNAQDWETITVEILQFRNFSERRVDVELHFIDSWGGKNAKQTIAFIFEEENWFVDDIINEGDESVKKYAKDYVNRYR